MKTFGLIGHPLSHSFSKAWFTAKFEREGLDCQYLNFDLESLDRLPSLREQYPELLGFNVTHPYKESILPYLDELDPVAAEVGAVNTVKVLRDGRLKGFNTDVTGFATLLSTHAIIGKERPSALILGTGGASKAVQYTLEKQEFQYQIVSRTQGLADFTYESLTKEIIESHRLIINATPIGMAPLLNEAPPIPYEALTSHHILIDLIYNPEETLFLQKGQAAGASTLNGLTMLHAQASASWCCWCEKKPSR